MAVVEDDERLRELWTDVLEAEGYEVHNFSDGETFVRSDMGQFDVALIDLMLKWGGMHGVTVIRTASHFVTCIALSGSSATDLASAHLAGAKLAVEKPAAIRGVKEVIRAALALYGSQRVP